MAVAASSPSEPQNRTTTPHVARASVRATGLATVFQTALHALSTPDLTEKPVVSCDDRSSNKMIPPQHYKNPSPGYLNFPP